MSTSRRSASNWLATTAFPSAVVSNSSMEPNLRPAHARRDAGWGVRRAGRGLKELLARNHEMSPELRHDSERLRRGWTGAVAPR